MKPGQTVVLKSGGPPMVVSGSRDPSDGIVACEWFNNRELMRDSFDAANLRIVSDTDKIILDFWHRFATCGASS